MEKKLHVKVFGPVCQGAGLRGKGNAAPPGRAAARGLCARRRGAPAEAAARPNANLSINTYIHTQTRIHTHKHTHTYTHTVFVPHVHVPPFVPRACESSGCRTLASLLGVGLLFLILVQPAATLQSHHTSCADGQDSHFGQVVGAPSRVTNCRVVRWNMSAGGRKD